MSLFRKDRPLPDMSRFEGDQTSVESGNKFTVADWEIKTDGWQLPYKAVVERAKETPLLRRELAARELRVRAESGDFSAHDAGILVFNADILSLNDDALGRLHTALENNERAGKLAKPPERPRRGGFLSRFRK